MAVTSTGHLYAWGCADGGWTGLQCPPGVLRCVEPGPVAALDSEAGAAASSARTFDSDHIVLLPERVASLQKERSLPSCDLLQHRRVTDNFTDSLAQMPTLYSMALVTRPHARHTYPQPRHSLQSREIRLPMAQLPLVQSVVDVQTVTLTHRESAARRCAEASISNPSLCA
eukprot:TRINITY_DN5870_c0_g1_i3.p2 TRINITY_DN5870_c0_g1~~TRINITY_DN5870_c0_g1_i3.p2  ORF type:complete len:171 (+),score=20.44 TRINITY_DN5870_c0_g1_i3:433-945(+)